MNSKHIVEYYSDTKIPRYWITSNILVGGDIIDQTDWDHLQKDFNIRAAINVSRKCSKNIKFECLNGCYDFTKDDLTKIVNFAIDTAAPIYLYCESGADKSPYFAYAILRKRYQLSSEASLARIKQRLPDDNYNMIFDQYAKEYIKSIEDAVGQDIFKIT